MEESTKRIYQIVSIIVLALCIYALILPFIAPVMERVAPRLWTCPFLRMTGRECPFCGITTGARAIFRFDLSGAGMSSLVVFLVVIIETAYRLMVILSIKNLKHKTVVRIIIADVSAHTLLAVAAAIYVIIFLTSNF